MPSSPAKVVAAYLVARGLGLAHTASGDWRTFTHKEPVAGDNVLTVYNTTARAEPKNMLGGVVLHPGIQVRIRSRVAEDGQLKGGAIERELAAATRAAVTVPGDPTTYKLMNFTVSSPTTWIAEEEKDKRQIFVLNGYVTLAEV